MTFLEKDLEDIIQNAPVENLRERGLSLIKGSKFLRQVTIGNYGRIDLIAYGAYKNENNNSIYPHLSVLELKQDKIGIPALAQLCRYLKGLDKCRYSIGKLGYFEIQGILIGRNIDFSNDFIYLAANCDYSITIYTYEYSFEGIKFKRVTASDYGLSDPGDVEATCDTITSMVEREAKLALGQLS